MTDYKHLLTLAAEAKRSAYAPYSSFRVGAALLCASGKIYTGCNIENAAYTPTCCAERTAIFKALSEGERDFTAIAVVGGRGEEPTEVCPPCGVCRQLMAEFCESGFEIVLGTPDSMQLHTLGELLPLSFTPESLD